MAKSTRSKVKRSFRGKKREEGVYAATEASRLQRLNAKLLAVVSQPRITTEETASEGKDEEVDGNMAVEHEVEASGQPDIQMEPDSRVAPQKTISTHGPRGSRREEWRASKGLEARPSRHGMNRQGGIAARRKAGRSKRRR